MENLQQTVGEATDDTLSLDTLKAMQRIRKAMEICVLLTCCSKSVDKGGLEVKAVAPVVFCV